MLEAITALAPLGTFAIAFGSLTSVLVAFYAFLRSERRQIQSNTMGFIGAMAADPEIRKLWEKHRAVQNALRDSEGKLPATYVGVNTSVTGPGGNAINGADVLKQVFNYYEVIAIGIRNGAVDEKIMRDWWCHSMSADFDDWKLVILDARQALGSNDLWIEVERLVRKWR